MTRQQPKSRRARTPWRTVQQRFFAEKGLDAAVFSRKHGLDESEVRMIFAELQTTFPPKFSAALARETGVSQEFFKTLSDQYGRDAS